MKRECAAEEHVDSLVFSEVRELAGERFPALLRNYLTDGFNLVSAIAVAANDSCPMELDDCARELRRSSLNLGVARLAGLCRALEGEVVEVSADDLGPLLREIYREFAIVSELLEEEIRLSTERAA